MTTYLIRVENELGREWYETREGEEALDMFIDNVFATHPRGDVILSYMDIVSNDAGIWFVIDPKSLGVKRPIHHTLTDTRARACIREFEGQVKENERLKRDLTGARMNWTYWERMCARAICGCLVRDCKNHGPFEPAEAEKCKKIMSENYALRANGR